MPKWRINLGRSWTPRHQRVRELRKLYKISRRKVGDRWVYVFDGDADVVAVDDGAIGAKLRAEILHQAHGRCQMCGRTVSEDSVKLQIDHKIPRTWGGATIPENLWAVCQLCNGGKRDYFATFNDSDMKKIMAKQSVYERIAETLRLSPGEPVPSYLLSFVANADDYQEDWQKRLRELRYPVIGMVIDVRKSKNANGKVQSFYLLKKDCELTADHKFQIKEYERNNRQRRIDEG